MFGLSELREIKVYQEGRQEGEQSLILRQLTRRIGNVTPELTAKVQTLSLPQFEALGETLLDFSEPIDLINWLKEN
jgi:predicted transposase YdaD